MSFKFYLYEIERIDLYQGMTRLSDYIKLCYEKLTSYDYPNHIDLKKFLIICFMEIKTSVIRWDGKVKGSREIFISAIPSVEGKYPFKLIAFKQENGDKSFLVSECKINFVEEKIPLIIAYKDLDKRDIIRSFHESYDLVEELFSENINNNKIIRNEKDNVFKEFNMQFSGSNIDLEKTIENKFDKLNYVNL